MQLAIAMPLYPYYGHSAGISLRQPFAPRGEGDGRVAKSEYHIAHKAHQCNVHALWHHTSREPATTDSGIFQTYNIPASAPQHPYLFSVPTWPYRQEQHPVGVLLRKHLVPRSEGEMAKSYKLPISPDMAKVLLWPPFRYSVAPAWQQ